jgi:hypothetical protein
MALKDIYEKWAFRPLAGVGAGDTPVKQSEGKVKVDFLPNTYQTEVRNRTPGDKVVNQATVDDATNGTFNTTSAFKYYSTLYSSPLKTFKSRVVHLYNAQGNDSTQYITSNEVRNTQGALYSTNL